MLSYTLIASCIALYIPWSKPKIQRKSRQNKTLTFMAKRTLEETLNLDQILAEQKEMAKFKISDADYHEVSAEIIEYVSP
jgi:hypothetical protein